MDRILPGLAYAFCPRRLHEQHQLWERRCWSIQRQERAEHVWKWVSFVVVSVLAVGLLVLAYRAWRPYSVGFAFAAVWLPMMWLGTASHVVAIHLPARCHELRSFENDGRLYERLGVRVVKRLLRRGPLSVFNPGLHLPTERTPEPIAALDQRMREAEASHGILLVLTLGLVANAAVLGHWTSSGWLLLFNVLVNGYPVMLQRYNRALLARRFGPLPSQHENRRPEK